MRAKKKDLDRAFFGHPKPIFSLSLTEMWERFSFYSVRPLLILFMSATMASGGLGLDRENAGAIVGIFGGFLYLAALPGGYLADNYLGQKKAVFYGAIIIALGHLCIALSILYQGLFFLGLGFIVIGTGLFKTCVSVMVGLLYKKNDTRRDSGFTIFYMGINVGAFIAILITGLVAKTYGQHLGFGIGGIGMLVSLIVFYFKTIKDFKEFENEIGLEQEWDKPITKKKNLFFIIIAFALFVVVALLAINLFNLAPKDIARYMVTFILSCTFLYFLYLFFFIGLNIDERKNLIVFIILFLASSLFWATFEQKPTSFNLFVQDFTSRDIFGWQMPITWVQSLNPLFIIILAPFIGSFWIFLASKNLGLSSITKFALGILGASIGYAIMMFAARIVVASGGQTVSLWWLLQVSYFSH